MSNFEGKNNSIVVSMRSSAIAAAGIAFLAATIAAIVLVSPVSSADDGSAAASVNVTIPWILVCSALVFIMVPGVAFFYGGMLRRQSMTSMIAQCLAATAVMGISWIVVGYSLAFGGDAAFIGNLDHVLLNGIDEFDMMDGGEISYLEFVLFQMMFAIVTATLVLGASTRLYSSSSSGRSSSTLPWPTGSGEGGCSTSISPSSTSPEGPWSTSAPE